MDVTELLWTFLRGAAVYSIMLLTIRLMGKRTVGNFSAFDLLVALMLGEVVDEIIYGDVKFLQGIISIATIAGFKYLTNWLGFSNEALGRILEGTPTKLVEDGKLVHSGMRHELMNEQDVEAGLRLQGVDELSEVKLAMLETDGVVSVIKKHGAEPLQKKDLEKIKLNEKNKGKSHRKSASRPEAK